MERKLKIVWNAFRVALAIVACFCFVVGAANRAHSIGAAGWSEVFVIFGTISLFYLLFPLYGVARKVLPPLPPSRTLAWVLRGMMLVLFVVQQVSFLLYLVYHQGALCYLFLIPDVVLLVLGLRTRATAVWATVYILNTCVKMCVLWPNLADGEFNAKDNPYGPNGLKALLLLIIPMIQFPVLTARLAQGADLFEAYTQNMAAVFAHTLTVMDALDLYLMGANRDSFPFDVQYMLLMFAMMGQVACNLYHVLLFFSIEDATEGQLRVRRFGEVAGLSAKADATKDERLLHYLLWMLFFVDLPFGAVRFVAFLVHSTRLSVFVAKNGMMMTACVMLVLHHSTSQ
mmetsp:Transcript_32426/g.100303  ORF Transcript_32426/g.100303 Transcript_32426/m.100303 type:complete len:343 (-) Transcript_32426:26-1054(-)|eukprot:CAMPEP_0174840730 /NCGR_PEP_ID=MMETSP1114-20130205/8861_1 /TAXON_ID=312471 /ORGANISM="Neobodo designis, Strain CCAP 1951/1" /LENGTH=342 /DNA_ID=CAMNT_0016074893 /DNA_START=92 /DNA_END=1120 /DNA_ORIENTATION=+